MADNMWLRKPRSMESLLPPNYVSDDGKFDLGLRCIRPAWLVDEAIKSLGSKFPMVPAPTGTIVLYTTLLGEKLRQQPKNKEFDLTDPLHPSLSYNYLHDEHLKVYFRSNDIRKRLNDEGFITDDSYVKCTLKEFNEYRQWIRKLKLDELHRERKQDAKNVEESKQERLKEMELQRYPELLEIMRIRRQRRKEEAKLRQKRIKKEQNRQRQLDEIDHKRREQFMFMRRKIRDRVQINRELERERLRKTKCENERKDLKIRIRIVTKMQNEDDERTKKLLEKKKTGEESKSKKLEEQWYRRQSWSIGHHENQKRFREFHEHEFQHNVEERQNRVTRQRRWSQVCFDELAKANRRAFEENIENAEVFMAKLKEKRTTELQKWKEHIQGMKASSFSSMETITSRSSVVGKMKKHGRRQSGWDLESCLLKNLGLDDGDIEESLYSKLGVISHTQSTLKELAPLEENKELGTLREEHEEQHEKEREPVVDKQPRYSIPLIVESLASIREPSSDSESDISGVSSFVNEDEKERKSPIKRSPSSVNNEKLSDEELRRRISVYVNRIIRHCANLLGVEVKFCDKITQVEKQPAIDEETDNAVRNENQMATRKMQVREFLSSILDKTEETEGIVIKRPKEYEKIKEKERKKSEMEDIPLSKLIDAERRSRNQRTMVRKLVSNIVQSAANQEGITVHFPPHYQSLMNQPDNTNHPKEATKSLGNLTDDTLLPSGNVSPRDGSEIAAQHTAVLRAISAVKRSPQMSTPGDKSRIERSTTPDYSSYRDNRDERLREQNLLMLASRVVIHALDDAITVVTAQRRNSDFFMAEMPKTSIGASFQSSTERTALLKRDKSPSFPLLLESLEENEIPREIHFLSKVTQCFTQCCQELAASKEKARQTQDTKNTDLTRSQTVHFPKGPGNRKDKKPVNNVDTVKKKTSEVAKSPGKEAGSKGAPGKVSKETGEKLLSKVNEGAGKKIQKNVGKEQGDKISCKVGKESEGKTPDKNATDKVDKDVGEKVPDKNVAEKVGDTKEKIVKYGGEKIPDKVGKDGREREVCKETPKKKVVKVVKVPEKSPPNGSKKGVGPGENMTEKGPGQKIVDKEPTMKMAAEIDSMKGEKNSEECRQEPGDKLDDKVPKEPLDSQANDVETNEPITKQHSESENQIELRESAEGTNNESKEDMAKGGSELKCPSLPQITTESSVFGLQHSVRSGAIPPDREASSSPERCTAGSPSSAIFRMITMRERQEECELSPQSSYVVLPKLSSSESTVIGRKMEQLLKDGGNVCSGLETSSQDVKLPRVSSADLCLRGSASPAKCPSQSSLVSLPQLGSSHTSLVTSKTKKATPVKTEAKEIKTERSPSPSKSTLLKTNPERTSNKKDIPGNLGKAVKSDNQTQKGKPISVTKSELSRKPRNQDETQSSKRRDSKYHSTTALVSTRRPLQSDDKKNSNQGVNVPIGKAPSRSEAVLPGRRASHGGNAGRPKEGSKTNVDGAKNVISSNFASHEAQKKTKILSPGRSEASALSHASTTKPAATPKETAVTPGELGGSLIETVVTSCESAVQPKLDPASVREKSEMTLKKTVELSQVTTVQPKEPAVALKEPTISTKVPSVASKKSLDGFKVNKVGKTQEQPEVKTPLSSGQSFSKNHEVLLKDNEKFLTKIESWQKSNPPNKINVDDLFTIASDDLSLLSDLKPIPPDDGSTSAVDSEPKKDEGDLSQEDSKIARPHKKKKATKGKHPTKSHSVQNSKMDSKIDEPAKKVDIEEDAKVPKTKSITKTTSRKISFGPATELELNSKNLKKDDDGVSGKVKNAPKRSSSSRIKIQDSKHVSRVTSLKTVKKMSEKQMKGKRSMSLTEGRKSSNKVDMKSTSKVDMKSTSKVDMKSTSKVDMRSTSKVDMKSTSKVDMKWTSKVDMKSTSKVTAKVESVHKPKSVLSITLRNTPGENTPGSTQRSSEPENPVGDTIPSELPDKVDSDTEVVVQVHIPDFHSPTEVPKVEDASKEIEDSLTEKDDKEEGNKEKHEEENSIKEEENSEEPGKEKGIKEEGDREEPEKEKNDDESKTLSSDKSVERVKSVETKNENDSIKEGVVVLSTNSKSTMEGETKKSSSRRAFPENDKKLMNVIPINSLDVLKGTKISPKRNETRHGSPVRNISKSQQSFSKSAQSLPRAPTGPKPQGSRIHRGKSFEGKPIRVAKFELSAAGFGLSVKSTPVTPKPHPSMQRISSKHSSNLEKVDEGSCLQTSAHALAEEHTKETAQSFSPEGTSNEGLSKSLSISKAVVVTKPALEKENVESDGSCNTEDSLVHSPKKTSTPCMSSMSFTGVVQGTQLLNSTKDDATQNVSPKSSTASLGSNSPQALKQGTIIPSPPITSKPSIVSPKVSRIKRNASNGSSGRSRASLGSTEMSPTASLEIVKLSSQTSHGWVSSPTSSVKFLPPIDARASKSSNHSDESQKRRPRTTESTVSRTESVTSRSSTQSKKAAVVEIRRSSSGGLRVDGKSSDLIGVESSNSGNSPKQTVIGF